MAEQPLLQPKISAHHFVSGMHFDTTTRSFFLTFFKNPLKKGGYPDFLTDL
jgi:hypothetical protein